MHIVAWRKPGYLCKKSKHMMTREEIAAIDWECEEQHKMETQRLLDLVHFFAFTCHGLLNYWLSVNGNQKCSDFGKMICSKIGNNGTMFSATRVQYYWQQCYSTSKGSIFLIYSSIFT